MNYQLNSYVNSQEAEALKELIFKRARERAATMTEDFQADLMNIARESFVSNKNPFSQIITTEKNNTEEKIQNTEKTSALREYVEVMEENTEEIGFPIKNIPSGAVNQNKIIKEQLTAAQVQNTMAEAREGLSNKKSFMGALEFLNSHAAASLLNKRAGHGVNIIA